MQCVPRVMVEADIQKSSSQGDCPLVTFALFAYNQEQYIREAVEAALAQTYEPLEIIFSDDCSSDRTFDIIEELVKEYVGPHKVLLNKNQVNLGSSGLGRHVNHVLAMAKGQLVVFAAGDDISLPCRTKELVQLWSKTGQPPCSLHSAVETLSTDPLDTGKLISGCASFDGVNIQEGIRLGMKGVLGASHAITKNLFDHFGPLPEGTIFEDRTLAFRSLLAGKVLYCPKALVRYRQHSESITSRKNYEDQIRWERWIDGTIAQYKSFLADYQLFMANQPLDGAVLSAINAKIRRAERSRNLVSGNQFGRALAAFHYSEDFSFSDRIAFILQSAGLKKNIIYKSLSLIWKIKLKLNRKVSIENFNSH